MQPTRHPNPTACNRNPGRWGPQQFLFEEVSTRAYCTTWILVYNCTTLSAPEISCSQHQACHRETPELLGAPPKQHIQLLCLLLQDVVPWCLTVLRSPVGLVKGCQKCEHLVVCGLATFVALGSEPASIPLVEALSFLSELEAPQSA